jgi:methionine-rich copper-binding protein CopC
VVSTFPVANSGVVAINTAIAVIFSEAIDPATINAQTFTLTKGGVTVAGSVECFGTTALFTPDADLSANASYSATVTTGVKDLTGNTLAANYSWQFTTGGSLDVTEPSVLTIFPAANAGAVAMNTAIAVTFSETIDPASINPQTFTLKKDGVTPVTGSVSYFGSNAVFRPDANLLANASYSATVTTGVKDLAGNALAANVSWDFTTGSATDTAFPVVQTFSPPNNATNVGLNDPFTVTFDEPIMPFEYGQIDGRPVTVSFNATYTTVTMKPSVSWLRGTTYTTSIRLQDMAGNQMPGILSWQFTTIP